jgi:hypothetical protein
MHILPPLAIISLLLITDSSGKTPLAAGQVRTISENFFRCSNEDTMKKFMTLVFQFETKRALAFLQENECGLLAKGEFATVDVLAQSAAVACVRVQADRRCAWVPTMILQ